MNGGRASLTAHRNEKDRIKSVLLSGTCADASPPLYSLGLSLSATPITSTHLKILTLPARPPAVPRPMKSSIESWRRMRPGRTGPSSSSPPLPAAFGRGWRGAGGGSRADPNGRALKGVSSAAMGGWIGRAGWRMAVGRGTDEGRVSSSRLVLKWPRPHPRRDLASWGRPRDGPCAKSTPPSFFDPSFSHEQAGGIGGVVALPKISRSSPS